MGSLSNFNQSVNIQELINKNDIKTFVETGCFRGNSLDYALKFNNIQKLYSCDIDEYAIEQCNQRFKNKNISLHHCDSVSFLKQILPEISTNCLFWLDAHLPDFEKTSGQTYTDNKHNFPLEKELSIIHKSRKKFNDIIIVDDLRIYEDGDFEGGNWKDRNKFGTLNLDFLKKYNYDVQKFYSQEGYILLQKTKV